MCIVHVYGITFSSRIKTSHDQDQSRPIKTRFQNRSVKCVEMDPTLAQNICNSQREREEEIVEEPSIQITISGMSCIKKVTDGV